MISYGKLFAADLKLGTKETTLGGGQLEVASVAPAVVLKAVNSGAQAKVIKADLKAGFGVVHVIDAVLLP